MDSQVHLFTLNPEFSTELQRKTELAAIEVCDTDSDAWPISLRLDGHTVHLSEDAARKIRFELAAVLMGMEHDALSVVRDD